MRYRSHSSSNENETKNHIENLEYRKKANKLKNYHLKKEKEYYKKANKDHNINYDKSHEQKKRSRSDYSSSNYSRRKNSLDDNRNRSKSNYHDVDHNTRYKGRKGFDDRRSNSGIQSGKRHNNFDRQRFNREPYNQEKYRKQPDINSNHYSSKKYSKEKSIPKHSNVDKVAESGEEEKEERYASGNDKVNPKEEYSHNSEEDSSRISDEKGEISDYDEEEPRHSPILTKEKHVSIITRTMWDPEPENLEIYKFPQQPFNHINYVDTGTPPCHSQEECIKVLKFIKERDKSIKHNFYIGGDQFIYEGKGWVADVNEETGFRKRAFDVAFIGTFSVKSAPKSQMLGTAFDFVYYCIISRMVYQNSTSFMFKELHSHG